MAKLFGFSIDDNEKLTPSTLSPVPPNNEDGADHYITSGFFGSHIDIEGVYRTEFDLIRRYREMALHHEVSNAIEDIVNEAIVSDTNDSPIKIELSNLNASDDLKEIIRSEFHTILELLDFDKKAHEIYRNWYIDGRLYYHKVIDLERPTEGIKELRYIDAMKMRYVRRAKNTEDRKNLKTNLRGEINPMDLAFPEIEEYFVYHPRAEQPIGTPTTGQTAGSDAGIKFAKDSIAYCTSGLVDRNKGTTLSYLNIAIKPLNQLRMIEDAIVIYRLTRSVERRIFYIDVGNLPKVKAEQFLRETMLRYRNKLNYNSTTGEVTDGKRQISMMEDFFLPRREGGRGTEITTLPGGSNLSELSDLDYFKKQLYKALEVPSSRIDGDGGFNLGRSSEILRDEVKFSKFVGRLRKRFANLFVDLLKTQLILKNIVTPEDWKRMAEHIQFDFLYDNHFAELKEAELLSERLNMVSLAEPYVGKYFSRDYLRRTVLKQTDEEIFEQDKIIAKEIESGIIPDPATIDPATGMPFPEVPPEQGDVTNNIQGDGGKTPIDPQIDASSVEAPKIKGAEI